MKDGKHQIHAVIYDDGIEVSCENGEYVASPMSNAWLWVLGAIAFPDENDIKILDVRERRQDHQENMTTGGQRC